jgi:acyl dehydratase
VFIRGLGGFGDKGTVKSTILKRPTRKPDLIVQEAIKPNQSIVFRINGDWNPIHIDPDRAHLGGYKRPILHGLCSFGTMGRIIYDNYC